MSFIKEAYDLSTRNLRACSAVELSRYAQQRLMVLAAEGSFASEGRDD